MPTLNLRFKVDFECTPPVSLKPALVFTHWLPTREEHSIHISEDNMSITLNFDETCTDLEPEEISNFENIFVYCVKVELQIPDIPIELATYIQNYDFKRSPEKPKNVLKLGYEELGQKIYCTVQNRVNRLISFARSNNRQYLAKEAPLENVHIQGFYIKGKAEGRFDDGPWFRFSTNAGPITINFMDDSSKYITESDWPDFQKFVIGTQRAKLTGELLAGAEYLRSAGHLRSAITEAVTALEVALYAFGKSPIATIHASNRLSTMPLERQISHLGVSGSIHYLLPLILSEETLPLSILHECQKAITLRQNIVHQGQRRIEEASVNEALVNIAKCCEILESLTVHK